MDEYNDIAPAARALVARKRRVAGVCTVCGKPFTGLARRLYCGHACAQRASYRRRTRQGNDASRVQPVAPVVSPVVSTREAIPPLVARLDALRARSRSWGGSATDVVRELREERTHELAR